MTYVIKPWPKCPYYLVDCNGAIKGKRGQVLTGTVDKRGYKSYHLVVDRKAVRVKGHTLVLETFVGPRPDKKEARHLNGIKTDNRLDNLCWGTKSENERDKQKHGTVVRQPGERHHAAILNDEIVLDLRRRVREGSTAAELARELNLNSAMIRDAVNGRKWGHLPNAVPRRKPGPKKKILASVSAVASNDETCNGKEDVGSNPT